MFKNASASVLAVCGTVIALAVIGAFVFLLYGGKDTTNLTQLINTILNFISIGGIAALGVGMSSAAKSASDAKELAETAVKQTNGHNEPNGPDTRK